LQVVLPCCHFLVHQIHESFSKVLLRLFMELSLGCSVCVGCGWIGRVFGGSGVGGLAGGVFVLGIGVGLVAGAGWGELGELFVVE